MKQYNVMYGLYRTMVLAGGFKYVSESSSFGWLSNPPRWKPQPQCDRVFVTVDRARFLRFTGIEISRNLYYTQYIIIYSILYWIHVIPTEGWFCWMSICTAAPATWKLSQPYATSKKQKAAHRSWKSWICPRNRKEVVSPCTTGLTLVLKPVRTGFIFPIVDIYKYIDHKPF